MSPASIADVKNIIYPGISPYYKVRYRSGKTANYYKVSEIPETVYSFMYRASQKKVFVPELNRTEIIYK